MKKNNRFMLLLGIIFGLAVGIFVTLLITSGKLTKKTDAPLSTEIESEAGEEDSQEESEQTTADDSASVDIAGFSEWDASMVYNGGDTVVYQNRIYKAKWWTQGETPGETDVWEDTLQSPSDIAQGAKDTDTDTPPAVRDEPVSDEDFKVVGYFASWQPGETDKIQYDVITHVIYSFAIPKEDGTLRPLDNPETAKQIVKDAHTAGSKALLAVGGWSYNDVPLEATFMAATATAEKREKFIDEIVALCEAYDFDGIDIDWEHPRVDGSSSQQYEDFMVALADKLHAKDKVLTSAVISGATADGNVYYDAAAHSDKVLEAVDWIHIMAYDGGNGDRHSTYEFAVDSAEYWHVTRGLPAEKVVLGVPFYGRPSWAAYEDLLAADPNAYKNDTTMFNGMEVWYNGIPTIQKKTQYALDHLGGVMIWELSQDTTGDKSLQTAIGETIAGD